MTDIALAFSEDMLAADLALSGGDLATDDGLRTAVILSLFTDARARDDDPLPQDGADRRGWWGDVGNADANDRTGSRLWLLERAKATSETAVRAADYAREALAWMTADGIAASVDVGCTLFHPTTAAPQAAIRIAIAIVRPSGARLAIDLLWDAEAARIIRISA